MPDPITLTTEEKLEPVAEQIVIYVQRLLAQLTVDNGYAMDVLVERFDEDGNAKGAPNGQGMIVIQEEPAVPANDIAPHGSDGYRLPIGLICLVKNKKSLTAEPSNRVINRIAAEVMRLFAADFFLGGYALSTTVGDPTAGTALGKLPALLVPLDVTFLTVRNDPYTSRSV